jgi:type IV pilus assembly protein PilO
MSLLDDLRNLDRTNVGGWPRSVKVFFVIVVFAVILLAGWWFKIRDQQDELVRVESREATLRAEFAEKQKRVVNLDAYKKQLAEIRARLDTFVKQLPGKTEMPQLLDKISQAALGAGIQTELFQPGPEQLREVYAEKPIQLKMVGSYHQFGKFISDVAALTKPSVILTMHDVSLKPVGNGAAASGSALMLEGTVKTYRYLDDEEAAAQEAAAHAAKGGK